MTAGYETDLDPPENRTTSGTHLLQMQQEWLASQRAKDQRIKELEVENAKLRKDNILLEIELLKRLLARSSTGEKVVI